MQQGVSPPSALAWLGRRIMDFGFAGFLEKFEESFGPKWTKALIALIALTVVVVCISLIISQGIIPIYNWLAEIFSSISRNDWMEPTLIAIGTLIGTSVSFIIAFQIMSRWLTRKIDATLERSRAYRANIKSGRRAR